MMKSFFKKLAFVMALAMVVSTAAPAATAFAADAAGIALQTAKSDAEILKSDNIAVGATVDYKFYGAPKNWKTMGLKWTSSDEKVATVAQDGKITGVADGVATIDLKSADGSYAVSIDITVGKGAALAYEVKQVSHIKAKVTFNNNVSYKKEDVTLTRVYDGGFEVSWPIKEFKAEDNVVTFEPYVAFADGDKYIIKFGADDKGTEFTTTLGKVDLVEVTYKTEGLGDMGKGKAYTNGEEGDELTVKLVPTLYSKGVDVTKVYSTEDVVYALAEENEYVMLDEYDGTMVFSKAGVGVVVTASYVYYDDNDEEKKVDGVIPVVSELAPAYDITGVKAWTVASGDYLSGKEEINWSKPVHTVPADPDTEYRIVALLTDNYGNIISTVDNLKHSVDDVVDFSDSRLASDSYRLEFTSTNVEKLLVDDAGVLTTFVKATTPVIMELHNDDLDTDKESTLVKNLFAAVVAVDNERKFDKVSISTSSLTLVTDGSYTDETVTLRVYDQYGSEWKSEPVELEVKCSVEGVTGLPTFSDFTRKGEFVLDGAKIDSPKSSFTLTFKINDTKSVTLKVTLKNPKYNEDGTIKVTSYSLSTKSVSQTVEDQDEYADDYDSVIQNKIRYYELSNGYEVGCVSTINGKALTLVTDADQLKVSSPEVVKGQQFIVVYDPNGEVVGLADDNQYGLGVKGSNGKYNVVVADDDSNGQMHYATAGTYTVKVLQVSSFNKKDEAVFSTKYSSTFKVTNENAVVKFYKQAEIESEKTNINDVVEDTIVFSLGGSKWEDFHAGMIADVDYVENKNAGYVVIKTVTINVPLNGDDDTVYYQMKVDVNKAVEVPSGFSWK